MEPEQIISRYREFIEPVVREEAQIILARRRRYFQDTLFSRNIVLGYASYKSDRADYSIGVHGTPEQGKSFKKAMTSYCKDLLGERESMRFLLNCSNSRVILTLRKNIGLDMTPTNKPLWESLQLLINTPKPNL